MRIDDIFIPKGNGLGWTLNFDNPLSWVVLALLAVVIYFLARPQIKYLVSLMRSYRKR